MLNLYSGLHEARDAVSDRTHLCLELEELEQLFLGFLFLQGHPSLTAEGETPKFVKILHETYFCIVLIFL